MASNKKYWQSIEGLKDNSIVEALRGKEFVQDIPTDEFLGDKDTLDSSSTTRRDFLKYVGFSTAAATLAACDGPVRKSIPYLVQPNNVIPGVADWYATSIADGYDFGKVLVKTREGRPILVVSNNEAGAEMNARQAASVLSVYDNRLRLQEPRKIDKNTDWKLADKEIIAKLESLKVSNQEVVLLTSTLASPSTEKVIAAFITKYPNVKRVTYDAISENATLEAFNEIYGERALPNYDFSKAKVIASIGADFIADWQGGFEKSYVTGRKPENGYMSYHVQVESNMSLTGSNADKRIVVKPSEQVYTLIKLYNEITGSSLSTKTTKKDKEIVVLAAQLKKAGKKAVVVTGINDKNAQLLAFAINKALHSEIIDFQKPLYNRQGDDAAVTKLLADLKSNKIKGLITYNVNPAYSLPNADAYIEAVKKLDFSVSLTEQDNLSASLTKYALPTPNSLESWGDIMVVKGDYGLLQPTINPLFNTRQFQDVLLTWSGSDKEYFDVLKEYWSDNVLEGSSWNQALHNGFYHKKINENKDIVTKEVAIDYNSIATNLVSSVKSSNFELTLYSSTMMGDGRLANNPWLQELPDPLTRASWDNYLTMSIVDARIHGFENPIQDNGAIDGNYAKVTVNGKEVVVPVLIQPGQAIGSVGLALGFGRTHNLRKEMQVGVNAYPLYKDGLNVQYNVKIEKVLGNHKFACIQVQSTLAGRNDILREATLQDVIDKQKDSKETWNKPYTVSYDHKEVEGTTIDLWDDHNREIGHHFKLSIDLTSCTGCGACVIACHAENNVAVVGKDEMRVGRDMSWLRIDRYYSSTVVDKQYDEETKMTIAQFKEKNPKIALKDLERKYTEQVLELSRGDLFDALENPAENPQVTYQPMMCQHCNHAPCETVCPVAATTHGRQGQNQMTYNRCVGTRYCANNCPYRVRRFNWFNYANNDEFDFNMNNEYGKMVLNPDVTVRSRGVMEKCSFCIQSTQAVILKAKKEGRPVGDNEFHEGCACASACSSGSMVFGDVNNPKDPVTPLITDRRSFQVLDYIQTKNNVVYQVKVRNTNES